MGLYKYVAMLVYYQLILIPVDTNIKLISDLGHIKLVFDTNVDINIHTSL
jgi:hypothetical protein